ncbi:hypothetical protein CYY_002219 [Polysphondylium violaceum]|uniref:RING-type domain-containing protein n=1 Tax=Polysphondylium violaceum TaxID=133409 RepID=A0A8J4Q1Z3_9MYCE|nr:hypothetical protein CYY_002219 [Polysphondylium violaceum]
MGKGKHNCFHSHYDTTCVALDDLYFQFPKNNTTTPKLTSKQLKAESNNLKKKKKVENLNNKMLDDLNNNNKDINNNNNNNNIKRKEILENVFFVNKNNISFSTVEDNTTTGEEIEKETQQQEIEIEQDPEIEEEEEEFLEPNIEDQEISNSPGAVDLDDEQDELVLEQILLNKYLAYQHLDNGEEIEKELMNKKLNLYKRSSNEDKKERIRRFYVSARQQNRDSNKSYWKCFHITRQADHRPQHIKQQQYSYKPVFSNNDSYEQQLQKALKLSATDYDKERDRRNMPLTQSQINDILNRELTPEDYELLLLLDASVAPKTVSVSKINSLPTVKFDDKLKERFPSCMICLNHFEDKETVTQLPCDHIFHVNCISNWLSMSSYKCPIDSLSIEGDDS